MITIIAIILIASFVFLLIYLGPMRVMPYLYVNARLAAREKDLMDSAKIHSLLQERNLSQIQKIVGSHSQDLRQIQRDINKAFLEEIEELSGYSPKEIRPLYDFYIMQVMAPVIKNAYRIKSRSEEKEVQDPFGVLDQSTLQKINESRSVKDLKVIFSNTSFNGLLGAEFDKVIDFERRTDLYIIEHLLSYLENNKVYDNKVLKEKVTRLLDIELIILLIRSLVHEEEIGERRRLFSSLGKLAQAKDLGELVYLSSDTRFGPVLKEAYEKYKKGSDLIHFEIGLRKSFLHELRSRRAGHAQGSFPVLVYLFSRHMQKQNLLVLCKAISSGAPAERIEEMII